jgi:hemolysin activation/secretion protein
MVQLAPFADFARSWNKNEPTLDPKTISSVGLGLRWDPSPKIHAELYWGKALRNIDNPGYNLQDSGINFQLSYFSF